jgi:two-component system phosphate regulon sensor histidine kinase PhoR
MNQRKYTSVLYFIIVTIVLTIAVQIYWNYKEYERNKQNLVSKVQLSLDNSVEAYYANLTRSGIVTFAGVGSEKIDTIVVKTSSRRNLRKKLDSTLQNIAEIDTQRPLLIKTPYNRDNNSEYPFYTADKLFPKNIDSLISKVFISISRDTLDLNNLDSYLSSEFKRNNISVKYALKYQYQARVNRDSTAKKIIGFNLNNIPEGHLQTISKSTFLPRRSSLELLFIDDTFSLLKSSFISIILSFLLSLCIIASLIYLLKTIYQQKQLAEVKNDLISNITHEFKTPISTIGVALESINNFNVIEDKEKTKSYIEMSTNQLSKLNIMVEKLLETASLDSNNLELNIEEVNIIELVQAIVDKHKIQANNKKINFSSSIETLISKVDIFHFENAINNILDNAIKYGGDVISIHLKQNSTHYEIEISDTGNTLTNDSKDKIFEKFYRVPKGNTHDVKGFGIGLYYAKKIIEKHAGTVRLDLKNKLTTFKVSLPNG